MTASRIAHLKTIVGTLVAIALVAFAAWAYVDGETSPAGHPPAEGSPQQEWTQPMSAEEQGRALRSLAELRVADKDDRGDYDRTGQFGRAWVDTAEDVALAGNGCDTRNDILQRDLTDITFTSDGKDCVVATGTLWDPYTGKTINFERGPASGAVQIEHIVALKDVWLSGGRELSERDRIRVANDPINLIAADGPTNGSKGNKDASQWMPPYEPIHCFYVASQIRVKEKYNLTVTPSEKAFMETTLQGCPTV